MLKKKYAEWMYEWETRLTTRDENRVVRPLEWGFEWIVPFLEAHGFDEVGLLGRLRRTLGRGCKRCTGVVGFFENGV